MTRGVIRGGINVSDERRGTQPPQDERLGTQPPQDERPAALRIAEEGEAVEISTVIHVLMKNIITEGLQKWRHLSFIPFKQILQFLLKHQKISDLLFGLKFFSTMRWLRFLLLKQIVMVSLSKHGTNKRHGNESVYRFSFAYGSYRSSQT